MRCKVFFWILLAGIALGAVSCQKEIVLPEYVDPDTIHKPEQQDEGKTHPGQFPDNIKGLATVFIDTPDHAGHGSIKKGEWTRLCTIRIQATLENGKDTVFYDEDSLKIKGRGNSTWTYYYYKRPYALKLDHKADFLGTGKTKHWVLLSNWMDKTLLRNDVAFEAARRTAMEWAPSGTFVDLYIDDEYRGNYWLGEKIHVEGSNFLADYLYVFDTTDGDNPTDIKYFYSNYGTWRKGARQGGIPVKLKYPDLDDYEGKEAPILNEAASALHKMEDIIYNKDWSKTLDVNSFCDWYIINELAGNSEPLHPKSSYFYIREGVMYAGPVWDFDWGTFVPKEGLQNQDAIYYPKLLQVPAFRTRLKQRWGSLKPKFQTLGTYIDQRAALIRESAERNFAVPEFNPGHGSGGYGNPMSEDGTGMVNGDEKLSFQEAVEKMKASLNDRIASLDAAINSL